ncbi:MAG TPA: MFS transporter [Gaiellaceae bacterium]|jgi:MFS family permease|nr:MFS transporter [Gaiellaceae bacterium]
MSRRLLVLVCAIVFVDAMLFTALTPLVPGYAEEFGLSKTGAGLLVAAFGAGALVGGVPGGLAAARLGPKRAVLAGLLLLAAAAFAFAFAGSPLALGTTRLLQGVSSTVTWAGALAWIAVATPRARRGQVLGTAFGAAVFGAVLGPVFGAVAELAGIRASFAALGGLALAFALLAGLQRPQPPEPARAGGLPRALRDPRFLGGLWLNTLPAVLFGTLAVLAPLALHAGGWSTLAIGLVFFSAGSVEVVLNPLLGRLSDRRGPLLPVRVTLAASVAVSAALAAASAPALIAVLVCAAAVTFGGFYTPGMTLTSHRAEATGLAQGLAFGVMNSAWALGNMAGPALAGALASTLGDAVPYLLSSALCALTLLATQRMARGAARHAI